MNQYIEELSYLCAEHFHVPCVQEVVTPFYIVTYYIKWSNYFLDTRYIGLLYQTFWQFGTLPRYFGL